MVEWALAAGLTQLSLWLMRQGIGSHWSRVRHPQGKVEHFHGELQRALTRLGMPRHNAQQWLDEFRWEHNHVRPHEALGMVTSASRWEGEQQALRSAACGVGVPCWRLGAEGGLRGQARRGRTQVADQSSSERRTGAVAPARGAHTGALLPDALPGARLRNPALDDRRALDSGPSSTPKTLKDVSRQTGKHVLRLDRRDAIVGHQPLPRIALAGFIPLWKRCCP